MSCAKLLLASTLAMAAVATTSVARAQNAAVAQVGGQPNPVRLLPSGGNACGGPASDMSCVGTRPANLSPLGINYADCIANQTLEFSVSLSGFTGADNLEVWASPSSDCTQPADRGVGVQAAVCWRVANDAVGITATGPTTQQISVRVQDLVGFEQGAPFPPTAGAPGLGAEACTAQAGFTAVAMNVSFVPVNASTQAYDGVAFVYQINTDLVGPPAPSGFGETPGETLLNLTWNPNSDSDTAGYNIFIDPIPGLEGVDSSVPIEAGQILVCPDAGAPTPEAGPDAEASTEGGGAIEASTPEASTGTGTDAGCVLEQVGINAPVSVPPYACTDTILASGITQATGTTTTAPVTDDAGDIIEGGVAEGAGGISLIPSQFALGAANKNPNGMTIADKSTGSYTIKGLVDGVTYTVVVAAVDGFANVGPPTAEVCDNPAPIQDFWQTYGQDGGRAGGFCALDTVGAGGSSLAGVGCVFVVAGLLRRRRRNG
jgi:hypothetical protein